MSQSSLSGASQSSNSSGEKGHSLFPLPDLNCKHFSKYFFKKINNKYQFLIHIEI